MTEALILALKSGLSLWESHESRKYLDETIKLEKEYFEEINEERPDMARLDYIGWRLRLVSKGFHSEVAVQNPLDK